jgi:hypothetical protein
VTDHADAVYADPATGVVRLHRRTPTDTQERLVAELVRAFAENAMLADALAALTHEPTWRARGYLEGDCCTGPGTPGNDFCGRSSSAPVHRTPAVIRAELDALDVLQPPDAATLGRLRDGLDAIGDRT